VKRAVIRTHGGLGSQIFQVFYALVRHGENLSLSHDGRYPHSFQLASYFESYFIGPITILEMLICRLRIVKLIEKVSSRSPDIKLGDTFILDGYFQKIGLYQPFTSDQLSFGLNRLKDILQVNVQPEKNMLCHIRLVDFYYTDIERIQAARKRLSVLDDETGFISSDDTLISNDEECQCIIRDKSLIHVDTMGFSAEQIFRLMSEYKTVESNNSTLAFCAAVLSDSELIVDDINLKKLFLLLKNPQCST
jgi:hypothetical protein